MPDPLTILGGVSASVQLIGSAAKASTEIYTFFRLVQRAGRDVQRQLAIIDEVKAALDLVPPYIASCQAANTLGVDDGLDELSSNIQSLCNELNSVRKLIPMQTHMNILTKAEWVLKQKSFKDRMKDIESRKTALLVVMEFLSMRDQTLIYRKTNNIDTSLKDLKIHINDTKLATRAIGDAISSSTTEASAFHDAQSKALQHIRDAIAREGDNTRSSAKLQVEGQARLEEGLSRVERTLSTHKTLAESSTSAQVQLLQDIRDALPEERSKIDSRFNDLTNLILSATSRPCSTLATYDIKPRRDHIIARIAREEVRRVMLPVIELLEQTQVTNEACTASLARITDDISMRLWNDSPIEQEPEKQAPREDPEPSTRPRTESSPMPREDDPPGPTDHTSEEYHGKCFTAYQPGSNTHTHTTRYSQKTWAYWCSVSWLGAIRVEISTSKIWNKRTRQWDSNFTISVKFWPSWPLLRRRCLALLYATEPTHNGYYQMFPAIATFPIISDDSPVISFIGDHQINALRHALANGLASPNDQRKDGWTLLHCAAVLRNVEACEHLLELGADASQRTIDGYLPIELAVFKSWENLVGGGACDPQIAYEQFYHIFQLLLGAGTDVEDWDLQVHSLILAVRERDKPQLDLIEKRFAMLQRNGSRIFDSINGGMVVTIARSVSEYTVLISCGLDIDRGWFLQDVPITQTLSYIIHWLAEGDRSQAEEFVEVLDHLLHFRADIYKIVLESSDSLEDSITTPTLYALTYEIEEIWESALIRAGYNPLEVYAEDERRLAEYSQLHGATTTAIDLEEFRDEGCEIRFRRARISSDDESDN